MSEIKRQTESVEMFSAQNSTESSKTRTNEKLLVQPMRNVTNVARLLLSGCLMYRKLMYNAFA